MDLRDVLKKGASELGVELNAVAVDKLWIFKDFLKEYNEKVNLTAITDDESIVIKHFLDCLTVLPYISGGRVIDIGTGPGFPGLVLKIVRPELHLTLLDARAKKVKFLEEAVALLALENIGCLHGRAEDVQKKLAGFDYALSRAVGRLETLAGWCLPFVKKGGKFIVMKGPNYEEELKAGEKAIKKLGGKIEEVVSLNLPNTDITRNLVIIKK